MSEDRDQTGDLDNEIDDIFGYYVVRDDTKYAKITKWYTDMKRALVKLFDIKLAEARREERKRVAEDLFGIWAKSLQNHSTKKATPISLEKFKEEYLRAEGVEE